MHIPERNVAYIGCKVKIVWVMARVSGTYLYAHVYA
jgi:hypothetical protein